MKRTGIYIINENPKKYAAITVNIMTRSVVSGSYGAGFTGNDAYIIFEKINNKMKAKIFLITITNIKYSESQNGASMSISMQIHF